MAAVEDVTAIVEVETETVVIAQETRASASLFRRASAPEARTAASSTSSSESDPHRDNQPTNLTYVRGQSSPAIFLTT